MASWVQSSFLGGEWSNFAQGRFDHPSYKIAMSVCLNAYPIEEGAAPRRPGFQHAAPTRGGQPARLLPFGFEGQSPYNIEFTDGHMRFFSGPNLASDSVGTLPITSVSTAKPAVLAMPAAPGWATDDQVQFQLLDVLAQATVPLLANRTFQVEVVTATTFRLHDAVTGSPVDGSTIGWASNLNVTVARVADVASVFTNGLWANMRPVQAETTMLLLEPTTESQVLTAIPPSTNSQAVFSVAPQSFRDGPYLDPFPDSVVTPDALSGVINLTLSNPTWSSALTYSAGDFVAFSGNSYQSLVDGNTNNTPNTSPTQWMSASPADVLTQGGIQSTDAGRHIRLFSEPPMWVSSVTYTTGQVVKFNGTYWTALLGMTGASPAAGSINPNQPGNLATTWSVNPSAALWTWGKIIGPSNSTVSSVGPHAPGMAFIGNMTSNGGLAAAFDGDKTTQAATGNISNNGYVGLDFTGASASQVGSVTLTPSLTDGFATVKCNVFLYGSASLPGSSTDGTILAQKLSVSGDTTSPITLVSSDQTTAWNYIWITVNVSGGSHTKHMGDIAMALPGVIANSIIQINLLGPPLLYTSAIQTWRLGLYNNTDPKWPSCGCYHEGRLWLAGAVANRFDASMSNDLFNMAPTAGDGTVADSNAISYTENSSDLNSIYWMMPSDQGIVAGTLGGEWLISAPTPGSMSPTNIKAVRATKYGCANIEPRRTGLTTIFVQKFQHRLYEYLSDVFSGKFFGPNLSEFAQHLTRKGNIQEIAYQEELTPICWVRTGDGQLIGVTYRRTSSFSSQPPEFVGWHQHTLGSGRLVESICTGGAATGEDGAPTGLLDALAIVTNDPETGLRHVEVATVLQDENAGVYDYWHLDNAVVPVSGTVVGQTVRFDGMWHLNNKTVAVIVAGVDCGDWPVISGAVTVPFGAGAGLFTQRFLTQIAAMGLTHNVTTINQQWTVPVIVGFDYETRWQLLSVNEPQLAGTTTGPAFAKTKRAHYLGAKLFNAGQAVKFGTDFGATLHAANFTTPGGSRRLSATELFSGIYRVPADDDYSYESGLAMKANRGAPAVLLAGGLFQNTQDT